MEEVVAEGVSVPLQVLELPEPQLGEEGAAPLLSLDVRKGHLQMQFFMATYDKTGVFEQ